MKKLIEFLIKLSNIINILACNLQAITLREDFYVYVPTRNKPKFIHHTFKEAQKEALRIKAKNEAENIDEEIQILQVVKRYEATIPF